MKLYKQFSYTHWAIIVSLLNFVLRLIVAINTNLGNDEVYYRIFALYPDWSHFDHPPMVGWLIQITTLNLYFTHEFFFRLGPLLLSLLNIYLIFKFVQKVSDEKTAFVATLLYNFSFYTAIVSGLFIMPDSPMITFWLLACFQFYNALIENKNSNKLNKNILFAGFLTGLAMMAKYHAVFLWFSAALFILFYRRFWLKKWELYLAGLLSIVAFIPVLWWNYQNEFISFTFHGNRVSLWESGINMFFFLQEFLGQIGYNNPILWIFFLASIIAFKKTFYSEKRDIGIFFNFFALPLILLFLFISLFRFTLPHWSGPAYTLAIIPASMYITSHWNNSKKRILQLAGLLYFTIIILAFLHIKTGILLPENQFKNDPSSELTGWNNLGDEFAKLRNQHLEKGLISENHIILSNKWFPAAHLDMYVASPNNLKLYVFGNIEQTHKFSWINEYRGKIEKESDAYFITSNNSFHDPHNSLAAFFSEISIPDTIVLKRMNKPYRLHFLYTLKKYNGNDFFEKKPTPDKKTI